MSSHSILIIGSNGRLGVQLIHSASRLNPRPSIHAFVRDQTKLGAADQAHCTSIQQGDATSTKHLANALHSTAANIVVMAIGVPNSTAPTKLREETARALLRVIQPRSKYEHVKVVVVSSNGSGGTKINVGFGIGAIISYTLRHVLHDHDKQEEEFVSKMGKQADERLIILRPTALTDGKAKGLQRIVLFGDQEKPPSIHIDRADLASWIMKDLTSERPHFGQTLNMTSN